MRVITITEDNIKSIYGRLYKFFNNRNKTGFIKWHNYDCGFKKHINPYINIGGDMVRVENKYTDYATVEFKKDEISFEYMIIMRLSRCAGGIIRVGDKIAFTGNGFILRQPKHILGYKYTYEKFQAMPMAPDEMEELEYEDIEDYAYYEEDY